MFRAVHNNPKQLHAIFESFTGLLSDFCLRVKKDGIYMNEMDSSHVSMILLEFSEDEFESYECSKEMEIGINLKNFVSLLKVGKIAKCIELTVDNEDELGISFVSSYDKKEYALKLMDIEDNELQPQDMDYSCEFDVSPNVFNDIIDSAIVTGADSIKAKIHEGTLKFISNGDMGNLTQSFDRGHVKDNKKLVIKHKSGEKTKIPHPNQNSYTLHSCHGDFELDFSLKILEQFKKAAHLVDSVSINISPSVPIRLDLMINDDTGSIINLYLAPKITDE